MQPLLYLVHRIPYPPDKGDKIRSYHLLTHLVKKYRVYVGAFVDDEVDWQYKSQLDQICEQVFLQRLDRKKSMLKSLTGLFNNSALTIPYYSNSEMQDWVNKVIVENDIKNIVVFSSAMAQYADTENRKSITRIIDFVDVDSDKWRQYATSKPWPFSWLYKREAERLLTYETHIAHTFDASLFVSQAEAEHFKSLTGESLIKIDYFYNGVDTDYFSPQHSFASPFQDYEKAIVFTGAMDYWANVDAVIWFAQQIFPYLYAQDRNARFYIVGARPSAAVHDLAQQKGVVVTGRVPDVRPFLAHSSFSVAPMRIARGIQNKVLEAMAMGCRVLLTSQGAEGISAQNGSEWLVADSVSDMQASASALLEQNTYEDMGKKARVFVEKNFNWDVNLSRFDKVLP